MREPGVLDHAGGFLDLLGRGAVAQHRDDRVERCLGHVVQLAVERRRVGLDRERAQHLPRVAAEGRAELDDHRVAGSDPPSGRVLGRVGPARVAHRRDAEVVDVRRAAVRHVRPLDQVGELPLGEPAAQPRPQRLDGGVGQRGTDPQPLQLLGRLVLPQPGVVGAEVDELDTRRRQRACGAGRQRADDAERAAPCPRRSSSARRCRPPTARPTRRRRRGRASGPAGRGCRSRRTASRGGRPRRQPTPRGSPASRSATAPRCRTGRRRPAAPGRRRARRRPRAGRRDGAPSRPR